MKRALNQRGKQGRIMIFFNNKNKYKAFQKFIGNGIKRNLFGATNKKHAFKEGVFRKSMEMYIMKNLFRNLILFL